jgi:hypothetical protein
MQTTERRKQELAQTEAAIADSVQRVVLLLTETLEREAADCEVSAAKNGTPYGEAFQTTGIVLRSLAKKLRAESEKQNADFRRAQPDSAQPEP